MILTAVIGATVAPMFFFSGLKLTTAADAALLSNGETVFSVLFALLFFKEKLNRSGYAAVIIILVGVFIVTTNLKFSKYVLEINAGNLLVIAATIAWALDNNISKVITRHMHISRLVQLKSLIGGGIAMLLILIIQIPVSIQYNQIIPILAVGVFGFALSLYLYLHSIKRIGVVKGSSILSLSAVFGLIFAVLFLRETISVYQILAIAIMLIGIFLMYKTEARKEIERRKASKIWNVPTCFF